MKELFVVTGYRRDTFQDRHPIGIASTLERAKEIALYWYEVRGYKYLAQISKYEIDNLDCEHQAFITSLRDTDEGLAWHYLTSEEVKVTKEEREKAIKQVEEYERNTNNGT